MLYLRLTTTYLEVRSLGWISCKYYFLQKLFTVLIVYIVYMVRRYCRCDFEASSNIDVNVLDCVCSCMLV